MAGIHGRVIERASALPPLKRAANPMPRVCCALTLAGRADRPHGLAEETLEALVAHCSKHCAAQRGALLFGANVFFFDENLRARDRSAQPREMRFELFHRARRDSVHVAPL